VQGPAGQLVVNVLANPAVRSCRLWEQAAGSWQQLAQVLHAPICGQRYYAAGCLPACPAVLPPPSICCAMPCCAVLCHAVQLVTLARVAGLSAEEAAIFKNTSILLPEISATGKPLLRGLGARHASSLAAPGWRLRGTQGPCFKLKL
jgi:hypothetical protein